MTLKSYACSTWPRPTPESTYLVQDGWHEYLENGQMVRGAAKWKRIKVFTEHFGCQYDKTATDPRCAACQHNPQAIGI